MGDAGVDIGHAALLLLFLPIGQQKVLQQLRAGAFVDLLGLDAQNGRHLKGRQTVAANVEEGLLDAQALAAQNLLKSRHDPLLLLGLGRNMGYILALDALLDHLHGFLALDLHGGRLGEIPGNEIQLHHPLVGGHRAVDLFDLQFDVFDNRLIVDIHRLEGGGDLAAAFIDHHILDALDGHEVGFQLFGIDVLAVVENDQVLGPAGDVQITVLIEVTQVTGTEIAVLGEGFGSGLGVLVVTQHDTGTLDQDLAVLDLHIHIGHGLAHGLEFIHFRIVGGDQGRAFRQAVALVHIDAKLIKGLGDLRPQGGAANDHIGQVAAKLLQQALVQQPPGIDLQETQHPVDAVGQHDLAAVFAIGDAFHHLLVENLRNGRHHKDDRRLKAVQVGDDILQPIIDADRSAAVDHAQIVHRQLKGVMNGQHGHDHRCSLQVLGIVHLMDLVDVGNDISLTEHNALAQAGGAGGKEDLRQAVRIDGGQLSVLGHQDILIGDTGKADDLLDLIVSGADGRHQPLELLRYKHRIHIAQHQQVQDLTVRQHPVYGNHHIAAAGNAQEGGHPVIAGGADDGNVLTLPALLHKPGGNGIDIPFKGLEALIYNVSVHNIAVNVTLAVLFGDGFHKILQIYKCLFHKKLRSE